LNVGNALGGNGAVNSNSISAGTTIVATGNITGGNINTGGIVSATGNVISGAVISATGNISTAANIAGGNIEIATQINSLGRQWNFEYTLALCKEMLGYVRGKYQNTIPIPEREISLNSSDLIAAATAEKNTLIERLRIYFDETSRRALLERKSAEGDEAMKELNKSPMVIYIG
jgi:hypothetical protein